MSLSQTNRTTPSGRVVPVLVAIFYVLGVLAVMVLAGISFLLTVSLSWVLETWDGIGMSEIMYLLSSSTEGTSETIIWDYLEACVIPSFLMVCFLMVFSVVWRKHKGKFFLLAGTVLVVSVLCLAEIAQRSWTELHVEDYLYGQQTYSTFIEHYYADPAKVDISFPEERRNLIYIYLESMEITYADEQNGGGFTENVIPELTALAQEYEDFSGEADSLNGGYTMPNTTWTMAAMFAQSSGLPLCISIGSNNMDTQEYFFPGTTTLGDILESAGYAQYLMIGSDAVFGGRELFFSEHGNYTIYDYGYAQETGLIPEDYRVWWGYEDQKLFAFAKDKLLEIAERDEPFNFTLLTVDTHFTDGYVCELCGNEFGDNQYANVMACSSKQVADFVAWVQDQDFYENTTIVVAGDHLTMDGDFCDGVDVSYPRRTYTAFINADATAELSEARTYTTFDMFPTTLAALGVQIEGDRLGLGTNLFSSTATLTEEFGLDYVEQELSKSSELLEEMASLENTIELMSRNGDYIEPELTLQGDGIVSVRANLGDVTDDVQSAALAMWKKDDQSDIIWFDMNRDTDGNYVLDVDMSLYNYESGYYYIHLYAEDSSGSSFLMGETALLFEDDG